MTKQLYYKDTMKFNFTSEIISKSENSGLWDVELKSTYFYPEGGGQPGDRGTIDGIEVVDVVKNRDRIIHKLRSEPSNSSAKCSIDIKHRIHYMRQHTAQHLVSGILKKELDIDTVSVHLSESYITIDILRSYISDDEIKTIENRAMELIKSNNRIIYHVTDMKGLEKLNIRRDSTVQDNIRVVEIEGYDMVPCGGVHLSSIGEIGLLKISSWEKIRGNIRLNLLVGDRAYSDYRTKLKIISQINRLLSTKDGGIIEAIEKLKEKISSLTFQKTILEKYIVSTEVDLLINYKNSVKIYSDLPKGVCKSIAGKLRKQLDNPILLIDNSETLNWFLIDSKDGVIDFASFKNNLLPIINGRGGGKEIWQGSGEKMKIMEFAEKTSNYLATN